VFGHRPDEEVIDEVGWKPTQRRLGLRINVGRRPTREELPTAVATSGLSAIRLEGEDLQPTSRPQRGDPGESLVALNAADEDVAIELLSPDP